MPGDVPPGRAVADPATTVFHFCLYVAGDAQNAAHALANLTVFCHAHLVGRHAIEVIDVLKEPARALEAQINMTPTLVVLGAGDKPHIIGTLEDSDALQRALGIVTERP